jgi:coiled-coil domain-containing protein 130
MQGFNMGRYVPPEVEGTISGNKLAGKHALGNRAKKAGQGILTVRFEMPFAVWCINCPRETIIGQGVRFNAEKKKVGNYHSSPIFSFRMKHIPCGGTIEIRTDPKNTAYVVTEGGRKRDTGEDKVHEGDIELLSQEERERRRQDAFASLEVTIEHKEAYKADRTRIDDLLEFQDKNWDDTYAANRRLRKTFRAERKVREATQKSTEALQDKMSLGLDILDETDEDRRRAKMIEFGDNGEEALRKAQSGSIVISGRKVESAMPVRKARDTTSKAHEKVTKKQLQQSLAHHTRAAIDPFLNAKAPTREGPLLGIKRKRQNERSIEKGQDGTTNAANHDEDLRSTALVAYDDDDSD